MGYRNSSDKTITVRVALFSSKLFSSFHFFKSNFQYKRVRMSYFIWYTNVIFSSLPFPTCIKRSPISTLEWFWLTSPPPRVKWPALSPCRSLRLLKERWTLPLSEFSSSKNDQWLNLCNGIGKSKYIFLRSFCFWL